MTTKVYLAILIVVIAILYIWSGILSARILAKFWRNSNVYNETKFNFRDNNDPWTLRICQYICIIFGPVTLVIILGLIFVACLALNVLSAVMWCKNQLNRK